MQKLTPTPKPNQNKPLSFKAITRKHYAKLGIDYKGSAHLAVGMTIINCLQKQMKAKFDELDADPTLFSKPQPQLSEQVIVGRFVKCYETNMHLLEKILRLKEQLVARMYEGRVVSKPNQAKLNGILQTIGKSKREIRDKLGQIRIKKEQIQFSSQHLTQSESLHSSELDLDVEDYQALQNGLQILGQQSYQLKAQLLAYSSSSIRANKKNP